MGCFAHQLEHMLYFNPVYHMTPNAIWTSVTNFCVRTTVICLKDRNNVENLCSWTSTVEPKVMMLVHHEKAYIGSTLRTFEIKERGYTHLKYWIFVPIIFPFYTTNLFSNAAHNNYKPTTFNSLALISISLWLCHLRQIFNSKTTMIFYFIYVLSSSVLHWDTEVPSPFGPQKN